MIEKANAKFKQAINIDSNWLECMAWICFTGGDRTGYLSVVPAYRKAYNVASGEKQEMDTYVDMTRYLLDRNMRKLRFHSCIQCSFPEKTVITFLILFSGVIGCDESEIASLA